LGLAIPQPDKTCVLGGSDWPGSSPVETGRGHFFGYVVEHFYFYGPKDWPCRTSYEYRGNANAFTLHAILIK
jgi:hypothetical protein